MADCYAPEMDDLHRRWLPREIFADIGIVDVAPGSAAAAEDLAVHLTASIFGTQAAAVVRPRPAPTAAPAPYQQQQRQAAQVCGFEGSVLAAYGGSGNGGGAPAAWPPSPYSALQWQQVATNFANGSGGVQGGPVMPAPVRPSYTPPPAKRRVGGTGVFLPRAEAYQHKAAAAATTKLPAKDVKASKEEWSEKKKHQLQQQGDGAQKDQQWQKVAEKKKKKKTQQESVSAVLLALPQEWTY